MWWGYLPRSHAQCSGVFPVRSPRMLGFAPAARSARTWQTKVNTKSEVDVLGVMTISRGYFERCCSIKKTPPYYSNLSCVALRNRRPTLLRAPAYRMPSEASPRRRCGHASRFHLWGRHVRVCLRASLLSFVCSSLQHQSRLRCEECL